MIFVEHPPDNYFANIFQWLYFIKDMGVGMQIILMLGWRLE